MGELTDTPLSFRNLCTFHFFFWSWRTAFEFFEHKSVASASSPTRRMASRAAGLWASNASESAIALCAWPFRVALLSRISVLRAGKCGVGDA